MTISQLIERVPVLRPLGRRGVADERLSSLPTRLTKASAGPRASRTSSIPLAVAGILGRSRDGPSDDRRGAAARRRRGYVGYRRASRRRSFGEAVVAPGRRRDEADPHSIPIEGRRASREPSQDVLGDGQRHPRHHHQAGRPAAQHADARQPPAGQAAGDRARNARHLRADRAPSWDLEDQVGDRRRVPAVSRSRPVSRYRRASRQDAARARSRRRAGDRAPSRRVQRAEDQRRDPGPAETLLLDLLQDQQRAATSRRSTISPQFESSSTP